MADVAVDNVRLRPGLIKHDRTNYSLQECLNKRAAFRDTPRNQINKLPILIAVRNGALVSFVAKTSMNRRHRAKA